MATIAACGQISLQSFEVLKLNFRIKPTDSGIKERDKVRTPNMTPKPQSFSFGIYNLDYINPPRPTQPPNSTPHSNPSYRFGKPIILTFIL